MKTAEVAFSNSNENWQKEDANDERKGSDKIVWKVMMGWNNWKTVTPKKLVWGKTPESKIGIEAPNTHYLKRTWKWTYSLFCSNSCMSHLIKYKNKTSLNMKGLRNLFSLFLSNKFLAVEVDKLFSYMQCDIYDNKNIFSRNVKNI